MSFGRIEEQVADWRCEAQVDRGARVLRNIALTGRESRNGYRYSDAALRNAARLYDHKPVFLDHADRPSGTAHRSTRDLVGTIINSRFEEGRVRSDVRVLDTESGRTFLALAEENAPGVGMSHVVLAHRSSDGATVERIEDVLSVDVVVRPATTTTLRESGPQVAQESHDARVAGATSPNDATGRIAADDFPILLARLDQLLDQIAGLRADMAGSRAAGPGTTTAQDGGEARQEAASSPAERRDAGAELNELLSESRLPAFAVSDIFREALELAGDEPSRRRLIADRKELLEQVGRGRVRSVERAAEARATGRAAFVSAIRGK